MALETLPLLVVCHLCCVHFLSPCCSTCTLQEWETVAAGYTNGPGRVTLDLLKPSHDDTEAPVPSHALSTAMTHALDTELHHHMDQQKGQLAADANGGSADPGAAPASPFSAAAGGSAGVSPFSGTGPAPAAAPVAAAGVLTAPRLERLIVRAKLLVGADGPSSYIRQQCIGDGDPNYEVRGRAACSGAAADPVLQLLVPCLTGSSPCTRAEQSPSATQLCCTCLGGKCALRSSLGMMTGFSVWCVNACCCGLLSLNRAKPTAAGHGALGGAPAWGHAEHHTC